MKFITLTTFVVIMLVSRFCDAQENVDYEKAYQSYEVGQIDESYIHLKNSLNANPDHLPSKILMGEVLALSAIYNDARSVIEEALGQGADANLVIDTYVNLLLVQRDYNTLLDLNYKQLTPAKNAMLLTSKAIALKLQGKTNEAGELHEQAITIAPKHVASLNSAAHFWLKENQIDKAKSLIDQSMAVDTKNTGTYILLSEYYAAINENEQRLSTLKTANSITPDHPVVLRDLVTTYAVLEEYTAAKTAIQKTLAVSPEDPMAKLLLSWVETKLGNSEQAEQNLDELVAALSLIEDAELADNSGLLIVSALANLSVSNIQVARSQLEQYISRQPDNFDIVLLLADVYQRELNHVGASNLLEKHISKIQEDVDLISTLCGAYINAGLNFKCNGLLERTRSKFGTNDTFIRVESSLLAARGKLDLALENLQNIKNVNIGSIAQKAVVAINANNFNVAEEQIELLLDLDENNNDFINLKASLLAKQNQFDEAEVLYRRILSKNKDYFAASFNLAGLLYNTNQFEQAKKIVTSLIESRPNRQELMILLGRILTKTGETDQALDVLFNAAALSRKNSEAIEAIMLLYIETKDYENAMIRVNQLLKENSTQSNLIKTRSNIHYQLGNVEEAKQDLRILFGIFAENPSELYILSIDQAIIGDFEGALRTLEQADKLEPDNFFVERDMAKMAINVRNTSIAKEKLARLSAKLPNNPDVLMLQADFNLVSGNKQKASELYNQAINVSNSLVPALIGSYKLASAGINTTGFVNTFNKLATQPTNNIFAVHLLGDYHFSNKNLVRAKELYIAISDAESYAPLPIVLNNLASIYLEEDRIDNAYAFAQQAYELMPANANILDTLGWALSRQGKYSEGLDLLRKSYSMNAQNPNLRYHLAYTLYKLERRGQSKRELKILLNDFSNFEKRDEALALQSLLDG